MLLDLFRKLVKDSNWATVLWLIFPSLSIALWYLKIDTDLTWFLIALTFIVVALVLRFWNDIVAQQIP